MKDPHDGSNQTAWSTPALGAAGTLVSKARRFVSKTRNFVLKMMNFAGALAGRAATLRPTVANCKIYAIFVRNFLLKMQK